MSSGPTSLPPPSQGSYAALLRVTDTGGASVSASKQFKVAVPSPTPPRVPGPPALAVIDQPAPEVYASAGPPARGAPLAAAPGPDGSVRVTLDASGSQAGAGAAIASFAWGVVALPERRPVGSAEGAITEVVLEPGLYQVRGGFAGGVGDRKGEGRVDPCVTLGKGNHLLLLALPASS
jgi:hypothetical protein